MSRYVILCGGRDHPQFTEPQRAWLDTLHADNPFQELVIGSADGADDEGQCWARTQGIDCRTFWANWTKYGKSAGPRRNAQMLDYVLTKAHMLPDSTALVVAFPGGRGTADMVARAQVKGVPVVAWEAQGAAIFPEE